MYRFKNPTVSGRLIQRLNRFVATVDLQGEIVRAHVPNSGRMKELLFPGNRVVLEHQSGHERKTPYDLILAEYDGRLVSIDSRLPNWLIAEAIQAGELPGFESLMVERREVVYRESRLDLKLIERQPREKAIAASLTQQREGYAEIKSCTLVQDGVAMFPDAPTERGARHLRELMHAVQEGFLAYVVFLVQREDAHSFRPNTGTDPVFATTLQKAAHVGVQVKAYTCQVTEEEIKVVGEIPVLLPISIS